MYWREMGSKTFFFKICITTFILEYLTELILSWQRSLSYRNQSADLLCKSMDWFLYDRDLRHQRVNTNLSYTKYTLPNFVENICVIFFKKAYNLTYEVMLQNWTFSPVFTSAERLTLTSRKNTAPVCVSPRCTTYICIFNWRLRGTNRSTSFPCLND